MHKFCKAKPNDSATINSWFSYCKLEKIPFVVIKYRSKLANIEWDYISFPKEFDRILKEKDKDIVDGLIEIFKKYANKKSKYTVSSLTCFFYDMPIEHAEIVAKEIYDFI